MGHSYYICYYVNEERKQKIIDTIKKHNTEPDFDKVGEKIEIVWDCKDRRNVYKKYHPKIEQAIIFFNCGGRDEVYQFFIDNGIPWIKFGLIADWTKMFELNDKDIIKKCVCSCCGYNDCTKEGTLDGWESSTSEIQQFMKELKNGNIKDIEMQEMLPNGKYKTIQKWNFP